MRGHQTTGFEAVRGGQHRNPLHLRGEQRHQELVELRIVVDDKHLATRLRQCRQLESPFPGEAAHRFQGEPAMAASRHVRVDESFLRPLTNGDG